MSLASRLAAFGLLLFPGACAGQGAPEGAEIARHVAVLAADSMGGRAAGTVGYDRAAEYAQRTLAAAGAQPPLWQDGRRSMLQPVPLLRFEGADSALLEVLDGAAPGLLRPGDGRFTVYAVGSLSAPVAPLEPVFLGYGISAPERGWDDYAGQDVRGRLAVIVTGAPRREHAPDMPAAVMAAFASPQAADVHKVRAAAAHGAAAVLFAPDEHVIAAWDFWRASRLVTRAGFSHPALPTGGPPLPLLGADTALVRRLFAAQALSPARPGTALRPFRFRDVRLGLTLPARRSPVTSPNVVALVEGASPELRHEFVVLSAHLDHLGTLDGHVYNGAQDDASGSAVLLSLARTLAAHPPRRSILFVLFTAEEPGLIGSRYFVLHPPVPLADMVADLNLDQVGRLAQGGTCDVVAPASLAPAVQGTLAFASPLPVRLSADEASGLYASSDHFSFHQAGVPALLLGCAGFPEWHRPGDDVALVRPELLQGAARFAYALAVRLADTGTLQSTSAADAFLR